MIIESKSQYINSENSSVRLVRSVSESFVVDVEFGGASHEISVIYSLVTKLEMYFYASHDGVERNILKSTHTDNLLSRYN